MRRLCGRPGAGCKDRTCRRVAWPERITERFVFLGDRSHRDFSFTTHQPPEIQRRLNPSLREMTGASLRGTRVIFMRLPDAPDAWSFSARWADVWACPNPTRPWVGCRRSWAGSRTGRVFDDRRATTARRRPRTTGRGPATVWRPV
eukprot:52853-Chlamydomonas_euryale.AAC.6